MVQHDQVVNDTPSLFTDYSYGPLHFSRMDAAAEHLVRGRDFGIMGGDLFFDADHAFGKNQNLIDFLNVDVSLNNNPVFQP